MDKRDLALQKSLPAVCVPLFGELEIGAEVGDRLLIAKDGIYLQLSRKWGKFVTRVSQYSITVPFGAVVESTQLTTQTLPTELLHKFDSIAQEHQHVEVGASVIWNEHTGIYRLAMSESLSATHDTLNYRLPPLQDGEHIVIDCHSHSVHAASFSSTDDIDDKEAVRFSYVVGNCNSPNLTRRLRLCLMGIFKNISTAEMRRTTES